MGLFSLVLKTSLCYTKGSQAQHRGAAKPGQQGKDLKNSTGLSFCLDFNWQLIPASCSGGEQPSSTHLGVLHPGHCSSSSSRDCLLQRQDIPGGKQSTDNGRREGREGKELPRSSAGTKARCVCSPRATIWLGNSIKLFHMCCGRGGRPRRAGAGLPQTHRPRAPELH